MKILIVDDVGFVRWQIRQRLAEEGYDVEEATSVSEALDTLERDASVRIVLTDLTMQGAGAFDLLKAARKLERFTDDGPVPPPSCLLMTSGRVSMQACDESLVESAMELGFLDVLPKPMDFDRLLPLLAELKNGEPQHCPILPTLKIAPTVPACDRVRKLIAETESLLGSLIEIDAVDGLIQLHDELMWQLNFIEGSLEVYSERKDVVHAADVAVVDAALPVA